MEPRHSGGVYALGTKLLGEALVVVAEEVGFGCVIEGDENGFAADAYVAFDASADGVGEVCGVPVGGGVAESLAKLVDGAVAGDEGEAFGQLEALLAQATPLADPGDAECRLVDPLQREPRFDLRGRLAGPSAQQIEGAQAQGLGRQV